MRRKLEGKAYVEQYVQSLTHEMKSPLAAIRGAAELLQEPLPEADRVHFARSIVDQQERLTETIDKLLALAEVEQHGWLQTRDPIALPTLLADAAAAAQVRAQAAGVQVRIGSVPDMRVQGDAYLLRQALHNLIDNAIAFSPPGADIALLAEVDGQGVRLQVADRGAAFPTMRANACSSASIRWRDRAAAGAVPAWACRSCRRSRACMMGAPVSMPATAAVSWPACGCRWVHQASAPAADFTFASNSPQTPLTVAVHPAVLSNEDGP